MYKLLRSSAQYFIIGTISVLLSFGQLNSQNLTDPVNDNPVTREDPGNVYTEVFKLFESGQISEAEHLALKMLETRTDLPKIDRGLLHEVLAFCAIANGDEPNGIRQFIEALKLNPSISPDPITWSPKMRRAYDQAFTEYLKQAERERHFRSALEAGICRQAALKSLYLPGRGQWLKEQRTRGVVLGVSFWGTAAIFLYSQVALSLAADDYNNAVTAEEAADKWRDYRNARRFAAATGAITFSIYLYTFADALWKPPPSELRLSPEP